MEQLSLPLILCLTIPLFLIIHLLFSSSRSRDHRLPPGPYTLPLIGETIQLTSAYKSENPESFLDKRVARFGTIFTTHLFGEPVVFSVDPSFNRFVLQNEFKLFESDYPTSISNLVGEHSLLLMKDQNLHKRLHTLTINFASAASIRDRLLVDIHRIIRLHLESWSCPSRILLQEETNKIAFSLTMKHLLSVDPCKWTESLLEDYLHVLGGFFALPWPFLPTYSRAMKARTKVADILRSVVKERRKQREEGEEKNDILGTLLAEVASGRIGDQKFSDEGIVDYMVALLVAGFETTSGFMTLAIKFLTDSPLALAQLKEEQDKMRAQKGGDGEVLSWSDHKSMTFTQCVIDETLRIGNIVGGIFRRTKSDIQVRGYTIPKGWKVITSIRGIHMNDEHYKDARLFNPWRWQGEGGETCAPNVFAPFGGGPRLCPGYELAKASLAVFLYHFVTKFSWDPAEEDKIVCLPTTGMQKEYPIHVQHRMRGAE